MTTTTIDELQAKVEALRAQSAEREGTVSVATQQPRKFQRQAPRAIPNKFGGKCIDCGRWVSEGAGVIRKVEGRWLVKHTDCSVIEPPVESPLAKEELPEHPVRHGIYTVVTDEGHATFRIKHHDEDGEFFPGEDTIGIMVGSENWNYRSIGFVKNGRVILFKKHRGSDAWWHPFLATLVADPESALEALNCRRCNRVLTNPASHEAGIGPECAKL
jgi:hypothetical protein